MPPPVRLLRLSTRGLRTSAPRWASTPSPPPPPPPKPESRHISIYNDFGRPFAKVFLMSVFTYQGLYWLWLKLEFAEKERENTAEVRVLEDEVRRLTAKEP